MDNKYRHIIFDLDRTLWDFDTNSHLALCEMYDQMDLGNRGVRGFEDFYKVYKFINAGLWEDYRQGRISREVLSRQRFLRSLQHYNIDDVELADRMAAAYILSVSEKTLLFPGVHDILNYLHPKYQLHVLTNGFADVQYRKLSRSGLDRFFNKVITSEEAGCHKPSADIFRYTLKKIGAGPDECLMVGDDPEVDLLGAKQLGIDQLWVNFDAGVHDGEFTFEVNDLGSIRNIL